MARVRGKSTLFDEAMENVPNLTSGLPVVTP